MQKSLDDAKLMLTDLYNLCGKMEELKGKMNRLKAQL